MRAPAGLALALAAGCSVDFDRYLATPPPAASDGGFFADRPDGSRPPADAGPPCTPPYVIAAVGSLSPDRDARGMLIRVELATGRRCRDIGAGVLPGIPVALYALASGDVAVASFEHVDAFDLATGAQTLSVAVDDNNTRPVALAPLQTPEGPGFVVAYVPESGGYVIALHPYTLSRRLEPLARASVPPSFTSLSAHPTDPEALLAGYSDGRTFTLRPSFDGERSVSTPFASLGDNHLTTMFALPREGGGHVAWVVATEGIRGNAAMRLTAAPGSSPPYNPLGPTPFPCAAARCQEIGDAVPDPADGNPIALCESSRMVNGRNLRHIVRSGNGENCLLLDGATIPDRMQLNALAVVAR